MMKWKQSTPQSCISNQQKSLVSILNINEHHSPFPFPFPPLSWSDNQEASLLSFLIYLSNIPFPFSSLWWWWSPSIFSSIFSFSPFFSFFFFFLFSPSSPSSSLDCKHIYTNQNPPWSNIFYFLFFRSEIIHQGLTILEPNSRSLIQLEQSRIKLSFV